jgi:hypothetical protein
MAALLKKQYSYKFKLNLPFYLEIYVLLVSISIINFRYSGLEACSSIDYKKSGMSSKDFLTSAMSKTPSLGSLSEFSN